MFCIHWSLIKAINRIQLRGELIIPGGDYIQMYFFRLLPGYGPLTEEESLRGVYGVCRHWLRPIDGIRKGIPVFLSKMIC